MIKCRTFVCDRIGCFATIALCGLGAVFDASCIAVGYVVCKAVTKCLSLGFSTNKTGLRCVAICVDPIVIKHRAFVCDRIGYIATIALCGLGAVFGAGCIVV